MDDVGPEIDPRFSVSPGRLGPPNHKLVPVSVSNLVAEDTCQAEVQIYCSVSSSEPPNARGDGDSAFDIVFNGEPIFSQTSGVRAVATVGFEGSLSLQLRAGRSGRGSGRIYTITCHGVDAAGNAGGSGSVTVAVPR